MIRCLLQVVPLKPELHCFEMLTKMADKDVVAVFGIQDAAVAVFGTNYFSFFGQ